MELVMKSDVDKGEQLFRFFNEIAIVAQLSGNLFERVMPEGLNLSQFAVLNHLVRRGCGKTPLDLAKAMQVTKGAMTNTICNLFEKGLISVRPDESDGRCKRIAITDKGREAVETAISAVKPTLMSISEGFQTQDLIDFIPAIERLRTFLDERRN
jgi:DNA-binding MarR family transcriptional regulator